MSIVNLSLVLVLAADSKNQHPGLFVAIFLVMGILLFIFGFKKYGDYRVLKDTPRAKVRSIPMGLVHLQGKAIGDKPLTSPLTGQRCFYYQVRIERWVEKDDKRSWEHYGTDKSEGEFYLEDPTGKVRVNPQKAEYDVTRTFRGELLPKLGFAEFRFGSGPKKYVEPSLGVEPPTEDALRAYMQGRQSRLTSALPDGGGTAARALGKMVEGAQTFINWENSKDRFRLTEECLLADRACNILGTCAENPSPQDSQDRNLILKGHNQPTFVISDKTEVRLEKDLFRNVVIMVALGGIFMVVGAAVALRALRLL